ncbi:NADP-dependent malic enzyme [Staphylococcus gallinarum]|jgi:malate dehydrogenase (oxaloacetate-decarboxylating)|uniref:NADP-dependent malic enzyme n=1 Tax=Staphylococcus gallinarum TaxID=1293 RepID=A0A418HPF3_STAGA|nr:NADP-dependent malic enzyme [Staphylococcus gallinarum]MCD8826478.1 NADP-dependent malic enzyme [Staphylococcus gallinarum]MCQ9288151.1 NADP-dependent malic enzyme [Staphylococcus gallinarum]PTE77122.1 NAD-dependent malic enzyme [Staphylococcus gallinarum]RIL43334.1 NADP-dependent malic enzyme [Staphylococcus gallinarum]RIO89039.1 NADP-dependent malic enzyme [Staphylococcus gallinarum]
MSIEEEKLDPVKFHEQHAGKIAINSKVDVYSEEDLSVVYTPGVSQVCTAIANDETKANTLTSRGNMIGVITDGTAVLGLGDIGPKAAIPVMEGKSILFKQLAGVDAFPISLDTKDTEEIISIVKALQPNFAGINLEDISAPRCFEIEKRLIEELDIPVFHDDQHGTAIVVLAALINAIKVVEKEHYDIKIIINGAGSAGIAIAKLLLEAGYTDITLVSLEGVVCEGETWMNTAQQDIAQRTNRTHQRGNLTQVIDGADVFIGVSGPKVLTQAHIKSMNDQPIIFALANPVPEIYPEEALAAGAAVVGTGRSDFANQINNLLAFPGIFRGILDAKTKYISMDTKVAAATAIASVITEDELNPEFVIPNALDPRVISEVAKAVQENALKEIAIPTK